MEKKIQSKKQLYLSIIFYFLGAIMQIFAVGMFTSTNNNLNSFLDTLAMISFFGYYIAFLISALYIVEYKNFSTTFLIFFAIPLCLFGIAGIPVLYLIPKENIHTP